MEKRLRQNSLEDIQSKAGSMVCDFGKARWAKDRSKEKGEAKERNPGAKVQEIRTILGMMKHPGQPDWGCLQRLQRHTSDLVVNR